MKDTLTAIRLLAILTVVCGAVYPLLITVIAATAFPEQASGSIVYNERGEAVGSALLAQNFRGEGYFWPRPSAGEYGTVPSGASNKGPTSLDLKKAVDDRRSALQQTAALAAEEIPAELLFASGSGLDPHISKRAARFQIARITKARKFDAAKQASLYALIERQTEGAQWRILGEERVNVLLLNLALDRL